MNLFKKTEKLLYDYKVLETKIKNIEIDISNLDYDCIKSVNYDEKSAPTNQFNSTVENSIISRDEKIYNLQMSKQYNVNVKKKIDNALETLDPDEFTLVKLRYFSRPKKSWANISHELNQSVDNCIKTRRKIIDKLSESLYSY